MTNRNKFTSFGRGKRKKPGEMNKNEARYSEHLTKLKHAGIIQWFQYEPLTLKIADSTTYKPDFVLMDSEGFIQCIEVKGGTTKTNEAGERVSKPFIHDAKSLVKIKVAAEKFPFKFVVVWPNRDNWMSQEY